MRSASGNEYQYPVFAEMDLRDLRYVIDDPQARNGAVAYAAVLAATRQILGKDNLSEGVMIAAIQAASYIGYRGVMGPKQPEPMRRI